MGIEPTSIKSQVLNCAHLTSSVWAHLGAQFSAFREKYLSHFVDRITLGVADRVRVKLGQGVTGRAAELRQAVLVADATQEDFYIEALPNVHSELAIPLIVKNRVIGVIDIEAQEKGYFTEEHKRLLTLIGSRMAVGIENSRLHMLGYLSFASATRMEITSQTTTINITIRPQCPKPST